MRIRAKALRGGSAVAGIGLSFLGLSFLLCAGPPATAAALPADAQPQPWQAASADRTQTDLASAHPSADVHTITRWILASNDNQRLPFAVVDKKEARLFVFSAQGRLVGAAPALLGLARGDHSVPGVGEGDLSKIPPEDRTTPAGRFASEPGRHISGERVVWIDYDAALSIHRLRPAPAAERRPQRLASASPDEHRISLGCVIVAGEFYDRVVLPTLGDTPGVVYVLPDTRPLASVFGGKQLLAGQPAAVNGADRRP